MLRTRTVLTVAASLVLLAVPPVMAGAGLPLIASLEVGPHRAALHNDSPGIRTGSNTLELEIPGLSLEHEVTLRLVGPGGQEIHAPLEPVTHMGAASEGHSGHSAGSTAPASNGHDAHGSAATTSSSHDAASTGGHSAAADEHSGQDSGDSFLARAKVNLPATGHWKAIVEIKGMGETMTDTAEFDVTYGGPNKLYLGATGSLMGGFILTGLIRRRRPAGGR